MRSTARILGILVAAVLCAGVSGADLIVNDDGFAAGTTGGITIGYPGTGNTVAAGDLWLRGTGSTIYFSTGTTGEDAINMDQGSDVIWLGNQNEASTDVDRIHFGNGDDCIYFDQGNDRIYFGDASDVTGHAFSHMIVYTDEGDYDQESTITVQSPMVVLQSFNERNPDDSVESDDYTGASLQIDPQDENGLHTGDVIITLGSREPVPE